MSVQSCFEHRLRCRVVRVATACCALLVLSACGGDFYERADEALVNTETQLLELSEALGLDVVEVRSGAAQLAAADFEVSRESNPLASDGGIGIDYEPIEEIDEPADLQWLVDGLAENGYTLRYESCRPGGRGGIFENAEQEAISIGIHDSVVRSDEQVGRITLSARIGHDHQMFSAEELVLRRENVTGSDCWPKVS